MWLVSTRGDLVLFRLRSIIDGKAEKEVPTSQYLITHDRLTERNWVAEVWRTIRSADMNDFVGAFALALELNDKEMDNMTFRPIT